jgi:hypothetical protein
MSRCTSCSTPTDLALSDVLSREEIERLGGIEKIPLIGTCGEQECVNRQLDRVSETV